MPVMSIVVYTYALNPTKMSHAKVLDLSGINLGDIGRQTRTVRNFRVYEV